MKLVIFKMNCRLNTSIWREIYIQFCLKICVILHLILTLSLKLCIIIFTVLFSSEGTNLLPSGKTFWATVRLGMIEVKNKIPVSEVSAIHIPYSGFLPAGGKNQSWEFHPAIAKHFMALIGYNIDTDNTVNVRSRNTQKFKTFLRRIFWH